MVNYRDEVQRKGAEALLNQTSPILLLNGGMGIGKTFLGNLTAKQALDRGETAIIGLPFHSLISQTLGKPEDMERAGLKPSDFFHFKTSSTWASPSRAAKFDIKIADGETVEEVLERCQEDNPLLTASDLCVRAQFCPDSEMRHYRNYRDNMGDGKIIVCTHSALIINSWTDNRYLNIANKSRIIIDEGDVIVDMAKLFFNRTINEEDFKFLSNGKVLDVSEESISQYIELCEEKSNEDEEHSLELLAIFRIIQKNWINPYCNILKVGNEWRIRFRRPASILRRLGDEESGVKVAYMSGTLAFREDGFTTFANAIGARDYETCFAVHRKPREFGKLNLVLNARLTDEEATELRENRENWTWKVDYDLTTAVATHELSRGHVLTLTASTDNTLEIAERIPGAIFQRRGENAKHCIKRFIKAVEDGNHHCLIGHGLWTGLDLGDIRFSTILVPRIPYAPIDPADLDEDFLSNQVRAVRKLAQGGGRGFRSKGDECTIYILDKRFPLSASRLHELGEDNRLVDSHIPLRDAIAARFDLSYELAKIVKLENGKLIFE